MIAACSLVALLAPRAGAIGWGDYRHDYLLPEESASLARLRGFAVASWDSEERDRSGGGSEWTTTLAGWSAVGLWAAGSLHGRLAYFAEGLYHYGAGEAEARQARADLRLAGRALSIRGGLFHFPFGAEARGASPRINRFIARPPLRFGTEAGAGLLGDLFNGAVNYSVARSKRFARAFADSLMGSGALPPGGSATGGRIGLSPRPGVEAGFSYVSEGEEGSRTLLRGADFSVRGGPLLLQVEWARIRREEEGANRSADVAYGRLGQRIVEYTERFDSIELLLGADYVDPEKGRSGDRVIEYVAGLSVAPRAWLGGSAVYRIRDEEGKRRGRILTEIKLLW